MPLLNRKPDLDTQYSTDDKDSANNPEIIDNGPVVTDDDLLTELDLTPAAESCSDAEIMAALDAYDPRDYIATPEPVEQWLVDVQELVRKHGPFSAVQILQIVRELDAGEASR